MSDNGKPSPAKVTAIVGEGVSYKLEATVVPVFIGEEEYELREASAAAACLWQNDFLSKAKIGPDGKIQSAKGIADSEPYLVSLCLFEKESGKRVELSTVRSWPSRIVKDLFKKAKDISGLEDTDEEKESAKNEQ